MGLEESVEIPVVLSGIADALSQLTQLQKKGNSAVESVSGAFAALKIVAGAALAGVTFHEIISSANESVQSINRLNVSLKLSGDFSKEASTHFIELADSIQKSANIQNEHVLSLVSTSKALGFNNTETEKLVKTSVDLAAVMGTSVDDAFNNLAKTLNGKLGREITNRFPEFRKLSIEALANGQVIDTLGARYAGAAQILSNNFGGASKGVGLAFEEILKKTGEVIIQNPIVIAGLFAFRDGLLKIADTVAANVQPAMAILNAAFAEVINIVQNFGQFVPDVIRLGIEFKLVSLAIDTVGKSIVNTSAFITTFTTYFKVLKLESSGGFLATLSAGFKALGASINGASIATKALTISVKGLKIAATLGLSILLDAIITKIASLIEESGGLGKAFSNLGSTILLDLKKGLNAAAQAMADFLEFVAKVPRTPKFIADLAPQARAFADSTKASLDQTIKNLQDYQNQSDETTKAVVNGLNEQAKAQKELANGSKEGQNARLAQLKRDADAQKAAIKQQQEAIVQSAAQNPIQFFNKGGDQINKFAAQEGVQGSDVGKVKDQAQVAQAIGAFSQVLAGPQGATKLISDTVGALADTVIPGIGGVVGTIVNVLAQGPEAAASFVRGFIDAIPTIIQNIVEAIPAVIEALAQKLPDLIQRLIQLLPEIAIRLGTSLALQAPFIAIRFVTELIKRIPDIVKGFVQALVEEIKGAFKDLLKNLNPFGGGDGGGIGGLFGGIGGSIGSIFGFADGGTVPGGAPFVDRVPSLLTPGETVLGNGLTDKLERFLAGGGSQGGVTHQTITLKVGENELASVIRSLNQKGFRTA